MTRIGFIASLSFLIALSQYGCNRPRVERVYEAPKANLPVDKAAIEKELTRIEKDWPRILKEKDAAAVKQMDAEDLVVIYPDGSAGSRAEDIKDVETGALTADSWEVTDLKVTVINADAALASGRSIIKGGKARGPDGTITDVSGQIRWIDTFARRDGQWKLVGSISTPIKNPPPTPAPKS
jgi:ketosteroid isomerase-like protein